MIWNSIFGLRIVMAVGILVAYVAAIWAIYGLVDDYYDTSKPQSRNSIEQDLSVRADAIFLLIEQSRKLADHLAQQQEIRDLLAFAEPDEIEQWARNAKIYVPGSLGLALISRKGEIIGEPQELRVGQACMRDMHRMITSRASEWLLIHRDVPGQEHYDSLSVVKNAEGENLGFVFISYRLDKLRDWLVSHTYKGEYSRLIDDAGEVLIEAGLKVEGASTFSQPLGNSQITLQLTKPAADSGDLALKLVAYKVIFFVLIVLIPLIVFQRFWVLIRRDLCNVLNSLETGGVNKEAATSNPTCLHETREIVAKIERLSRLLFEQQAKLTTDSLHDVLTGLPNRRNLENHLEHICGMVHRGAGFCVALVDMDNFKVVNDTHGHQAGDDLLVLFAEVLEDVLRDADYAARYAGDEFVIVLYEMAPTNKSLFALTRLSENFLQAQKDEKPAGDVISTLSIGFVHLEPGSFVETAEAMRKADEALYEAKWRGRNTIVDYSELSS
jgi:diguanylate cyclase (GGDEF)-like protein